MAERRLCYGCMEKVIFRSDGICPNCGYYINANADPNFILPGTVLYERYIIGKTISANGEGVTYLGYDQSIGSKINIREYMPRTMCRRMPNGSPVISVIPAKLAQYKALMAEFTEMHKSLGRLRGQANISSIEHLFAENNTTYVVSEWVPTMRLSDYLKKNAGELTWGQFSRMLPPLTTSMSLIHNSGVLHRAISPSTVYVTNRGELLLTNFTIAAARTANTELECEIYNGYAALEQYSPNGRQGAWTDVYAISALIYRVLTGSVPPSALSRVENDNLVPPAVLNPNVPIYVSDAVMHGMALDSADRIQNITDLVTELFDRNAVRRAPVVQQVQAPEPPQKQPEPEYDYSGYDNDYAYDTYGFEDELENDHMGRATAVDRLKVPIIVGIVLLLILLVCVLVFANKFNNSGDNDTGSAIVTAAPDDAETTQEATTVTIGDPETTTSVGDSVMPNLLGKSYDNVKEEYAGWITFQVEEVYSDQYAEGKICWQEYNPSDSFDSTQPVKIQVSKGKATVTIPYYDGYDQTSYCDELNELGISYEVESEANYSSSLYQVTSIVVYKNGVECDSVSAGDEIDLNDNYKIKVYYAYYQVYTTTAYAQPYYTYTTEAVAAQTTVADNTVTDGAAADDGGAVDNAGDTAGQADTAGQ